MSSWTTHETYLGDGLYAKLNEANQIELRAPSLRGEQLVYLEPEVFVELIRFARRIGWGKLIERRGWAASEE